MLNPPIVLAIPHLTPAIQKTTFATYLEVSVNLKNLEKSVMIIKLSSKHQKIIRAPKLLNCQRSHKPSIVKKQFSEVKKKTRSMARQKQTKQDKVSDLKIISTNNTALPNIHNAIQNYLSILHTDENMKKLFPSKSIKTL